MISSPAGNIGNSSSFNLFPLPSLTYVILSPISFPAHSKRYPSRIVNCNVSRQNFVTHIVPYKRYTKNCTYLTIVIILNKTIEISTSNEKKKKQSILKIRFFSSPRLELKICSNLPRATQFEEIFCQGQLNGGKIFLKHI